MAQDKNPSVKEFLGTVSEDEITEGYKNKDKESLQEQLNDAIIRTDL